ncbi:MAG TPA: radical SAM family heme chaperone HemW, partial [Polyangiaceae bacterium]|nr:radical SAM family heme chaperone HemW [Polyangiaceae bacterium]
CPYCDFVSYVGATSSKSDVAPIDHAGYADAVLRELEARAPALPGRPIASVFFGGGTPSLWEPLELGRVLRGVRAAFGARDDVEVTVECNPTSLDEDRARALVDVGVGRLSIGVQALDDERLRFLGRLHDAQGARRAVRAALRAGVPRVSADVIFGLPGQTPAQARDDVRSLADEGLEHLSCYQLTIEPRTRFGELAKRGRLPLADDGMVADSFVAIDEFLVARGLLHYEISNYARPGQASRHNLGYWRGDEYLGLGCGAYGFVRRAGGGPARGTRWRNEVDPLRYMTTTPLPALQEEEALDAETLLRERIMLGLRLAEGLDLDAAAGDLGLSSGGWTPARSKASRWLEARNRLIREGARARIPSSAWLWADDTAARLF